MSKAALSDFDKVLKSINASIETQNEKNAMVKEMHEMITNLSAKVDSLRYVVDSLVQTNETKTNTPKPKSKPKTKGGKSKTLDEPEDDISETKEETNGNKIDNKADDKADDKNDDKADDTVEEKTEKKKTKPKPKVKTSKAETEVKSSRPLNKMEFFRRQFSEDPTAFDTYLTKAVKDEIEKKNAKEWDKITDAAKLESSRCSAYYTWMSKNHESMLQNMKNNYNDDLAKRNMVIAEKDEE